MVYEILPIFKLISFRVNGFTISFEFYYKLNSVLSS